MCEYSKAHPSTCTRVYIILYSKYTGEMGRTDGLGAIDDRAGI